MDDVLEINNNRESIKKNYARILMEKLFVRISQRKSKRVRMYQYMFLNFFWVNIVVRMMKMSLNMELKM